MIWSTGKKPQVAPYSGDMFPIVARSASGRFETPRAEVLDELSDNACLTKDLRHGQDEVRRGRALAQWSR